MNTRTKIKALAILLTLGIAFSGFADADFSQLQKGVDDFSKELAKSLPFNSALGLNWSDAYIGKVFPSLPPHFGVGGSFGITTMNLPVMNTLAGYLGYSFPFDISKLVLPAYAVEARMGGLFLPFDIGFKFGYLPPLGMWGSNLNMDYLSVGGDLRYAVLDLKLLKLSLGLGLNYLKGSVGGKVGTDHTITFENLGVPDSITLEKPDVSLQWKTVSLDIKTQVSASLLIFTPYLGLGWSYAWSSAGYSVDSQVTRGGSPLNPGDFPAINSYLRGQGLKEIDGDSAGISSIIKNSGYNIRVFGGMSFNMMVFRFDLTGLYSFRDSNYGASFGFRFQL